MAGGGCSAAPALSSMLWHRALCISPQNNMYRIFCESCLTFPKAWEIQMGRCLSGTGLGLAWLLGRLPALGQQGALNQNSWRLGSRQARGVWQQQWLWVRLSCSGKHPWWQRLCVTMLSVQQCPLTARWDVLEGSFTACWWGCRSRTLLDTTASVAGQSQVLGTCSPGFSLHFVHQTWEAVSSFPKLAAILPKGNILWRVKRRVWAEQGAAPNCSLCDSKCHLPSQSLLVNLPWNLRMESYDL